VVRLALPAARAGGEPSALRAGGAVGALALVGVTAVLLASPWVPAFLEGGVDDAAALLATTRIARPEVWGAVSPATVWGALAPLDLAPLERHVGLALVAATAVAAVVGVLWRERVVMVGLVWIVLLVLGAYPGLVGWQATSVLKDFTVAIGLYGPAGLVVGGALGALAARWEARDARAPALLAGATVAVALALAWKDRSPAEPLHVLVTPADERALAWVREETPADALFLVSSFPAFGDTVPAGDDAGWWVPLLAERRSTVPPVLVGLERVQPGLLGRLAEVTAVTRDLDRPEAEAVLDREGVTHAYVGVTAKAIDREALADPDRWRVIYDREGVLVYERLRGGGP
jgi:hypothetical protein